jgi:hypothetical protein
MYLDDGSQVLPLLKERPCLRVLLDMPEEPSDVPADVVATLLKPNYSVLGSNKRPREELMVVKFREFLHCVQGKWMSNVAWIKKIISSLIN